MDILRQSLMYPNKTWNRRGPHIPRWFRVKLQRIDPTLVLQFMPPAHPCYPDLGVNCRHFPLGCWVICRRLRRSHMLLKQWVFQLHQPNQPWKPPGYRELKLLKRARNLARHDRLAEMATKLDAAITRLKRVQGDESRERLANSIVDTCRRHNITKRGLGLTRVSMRDVRRET